MESFNVNISFDWSFCLKKKCVPSFFWCCIELNCIVDFNESEWNSESQEKQEQLSLVEEEEEEERQQQHKKLNILKSNQCFIDQLHDQMNKYIIKYIENAHI